MFVAQPEAYARALASALVADMTRAPSLERAVHARRLSPGQFLAIVQRDVVREVRGEPGIPLFPNLRALARTQMRLEEAGPAGVSQFPWTEILTSVIPALATATTKYYTARTQAKTETTIGKLNLRMQETQIRAQDLEAARARAAQATAEGAPGAAVAARPAPGAAPDGIVPGIPNWALGLGAAALTGGAIYLATR